MKVITAILNPHRLDDVYAALTGIEVQGITVTEVQGIGRRKRDAMLDERPEDLVTPLPKLKVEVAVPEDRVETVINALRNAGDGHKIANGKILVYSLHDALRVHTREVGDAAL
ncbi:MAG: P-II family nitrogen regulator [Gammaproteobacteria bacterium]|jgi:nitrogen regulatory protein PII